MDKDFNIENTRLDHPCWQFNDNFVGFYLTDKDKKKVANVLGTVYNIAHAKPLEKLGWVWYLYVLPEYRGKSLAKKLLQLQFAKLQERGMFAVGLVHRESNTAAKKLYSKLGFEHYDTGKYLNPDENKMFKRMFFDREKALATWKISEASKETKQVLSDFKSILYKTSNQQVGSTALKLQPKGPFCKSNKFSDALAGSFYQSNSLNTLYEGRRYHDNQMDWKGKKI